MPQTGHPHFMGDVQNVCDLRLTYSMYVSNGRHMEHSHFKVEVQSMLALQKMVRTSKLTKHRQELPKYNWN